VWDWDGMLVGSGDRTSENGDSYSNDETDPESHWLVSFWRRLAALRSGVLHLRF